MGINRISLHIGAHKTATTHFQRSMVNNEDFCNRNSLTFLPTKLFREYLTPIERRSHLFGEFDACFDEFQAVLNAAIGSNERLFLSEENILKLSHPLGERELYPKSVEKLSRVRRLIGPEPIDVYISIRNYADFLPSIYIEYIKNFKYLDFSEFMAMSNGQVGSWTSLIQRISTNLAPSDKLFIWTYEGYSRDCKTVLQKIFNTNDLSGFAPDNQVHRPGISSDAFDYFQRNFSEGGHWSVRRQLTVAQKKFPKKAVGESFRPLTVECMEQYSHLYRNEVKLLSQVLKPNFLS